MGKLIFGVELRPLAYFVMVCQSSGLNACARELEVAHSSLSAVIHKLEGALGLKLFTRNGSRLYPTDSALWLFRCALPLLHLETAMRLAARAEGPPPLQWLKLDIPIRFIGGRLARAISHAIERTQQDFPGTFIHPCFRDSYVDAAVTDVPWAPKQPMAGALTVNYASDSEVDDSGRRRLMDDPWVLVTSAGNATPANRPVSLAEMLGMNLTVPTLPRMLLRQVARYCRDHALHIAHWSGDLLGTIEADDSRCLLLPKTLTESRLMDLPLQVRPLEVGFTASLCASVSTPHPAADRFIEHLQTFVRKPGPALRFDPAITLRQFRYFGTLQEATSMTRAAGRLHIAQPALSMQIHALEAHLHGPLFLRQRRAAETLALTPKGRLLSTVSNWMMEQGEEMGRQLTRVAVRQRGRLILGVLPAADQRSILLRCFSQAVTRWRQQYPDITLEIVEAPHQQLVTGVRRHQLHLVVLETESNVLHQWPVGEREPLGIVANPAFGLLQEGSIALERLVGLPLILPLSGAGTRLLLDEAAAEQGFRLIPVIESNSMAINLSVVRVSPYCTVFPASAIRPYLESGELRFHPIADPPLARQISLAHAQDRSLDDAERRLLRLLRAVFADLMTEET